MNLAAGTGVGGGVAIQQSFVDEMAHAFQEQELQLYNDRNQAMAQRNLYGEPKEKAQRVAGSKASEARVRYKKKPRYPDRAKQENKEGWVKIAVLVGEDGLVESHEIEAEDPPGYFKDAIDQALPEWVFVPAKDDQGRPIKEWVTVVYEFSLRDS